MRIVKGIERARQLLTRSGLWEYLTTTPELRARIKQTFGEELSVWEVVNHIINEVREKGDKALFEYTEKLDGVRLDSLEVDKEEIAEAYQMVDQELFSAVEFAARRVRDFHCACGHRTGIFSIGGNLSQVIQPLDKVGLYVPGGTAAYPSTVLMESIPARVAGVREIIMVSPPSKHGRIPAATLVAADIAKINRIFKVGGAQAIAALAFGTESIPRVDKICGPGNVFVTLAKKAVYGAVDIDGLQGPSEIVILADERADPAVCVADLLAQAEHDPSASIILISTSVELLNEIRGRIEEQLEKLERKAIIRKSVDAGALILVDSLDEAVELINLYAPEHVSLMVSDAASLIAKIHNAGCIFLGEDSPVALGDYVAGPSHVLPTGGSARFSSPLGVADFLKVTNIIALNKSGVRELSKPAMVIAKAEGLDAHARSLAIRLGGDQTESQHLVPQKRD